MHETGGRGDGDQAGDGAGESSRGRLACRSGAIPRRPRRGQPRRPRNGGDEGTGGKCPAAEGAARIEAEPADPQQAARHAEDHGVRRHVLVRIAETLAEVKRADQRGDAGGDVDDRTAGEIKRGDSGRRVALSSPPLPQTMWAIGEQTKIDHSEQDAMALNFIRSAKAPVISAGVMMANMSW